MILDYNFNR